MKIGSCLLIVLVLFFQQASGQVNQTITGTVTDSLTNTPIEKVSVRLKNNNQGTVTNAQGK